MRLHSLEEMGYRSPDPATSRLHQELYVPPSGDDAEENARNRAEHPDPERGSVRLHVWPKGLRKRESRGRGRLGGIHEVQVGDYHAPTVPHNEFAATLAFNPHRVVPSGPEILIGGMAMPIVSVRRVVTLDEKLFAKAQLLAALDRNP